MGGGSRKTAMVVAKDDDDGLLVDSWRRYADAGPWMVEEAW